MKKILITGVFGLIGKLIYNGLRQQPEHYDVYGLDRSDKASARSKHIFLDIPKNKFYKKNISEWDKLRRVMENKEIVIHLAAESDLNASWNTIYPDNLVGNYHIFEAAKQCGVKRIIFASSMAVLLGYAQEEPYKSIIESNFENLAETISCLDSEAPPRPLGLYAASKLWGESIARIYAEAHNMSCLCLRIGAVNENNCPDAKGFWASSWCSQEDMVQLVERCIEADENLKFAIYYGVSNNRCRWVDIDLANRQIGYVPRDRMESESAVNLERLKERLNI